MFWLFVICKDVTLKKRRKSVNPVLSYNDNPINLIVPEEDSVVQDAKLTSDDNEIVDLFNHVVEDNSIDENVVNEENIADEDESCIDIVDADVDVDVQLSNIMQQSQINRDLGQKDNSLPS